MKSIRRRLTFLLAAGFGLLLLACGSAVYLLTRAALLAEFDAGLRAKALAMTSQTEQTSTGVQVELSPAMAEEFKNAARAQFYQIWRVDGATLARSESLAGAELPRRFGAEASPVYWNLRLPGGLAGRAIGSKIRPKIEDETPPRVVPAEAVLVVATDRRPLDRTLGTLAGVLLGTGFLALAATAPLVGFSVRRGHAPLEEVGRQAAGVTADSLQIRFPIDSLPEELRPIMSRLNDLLGRLEASFERLWRKDQSRAGVEHHGLGLSLSRVFAGALGLSLTARFTDETTLTLVLSPKSTSDAAPILEVMECV